MVTLFTVSFLALSFGVPTVFTVTFLVLSFGALAIFTVTALLRVRSKSSQALPRSLHSCSYDRCMAPVEAVDLFCGAGGLSVGLAAAGDFHRRWGGMG